MQHVVPDVGLRRKRFHHGLPRCLDSERCPALGSSAITAREVHEEPCQGSSDIERKINKLHRVVGPALGCAPRAERGDIVSTCTLGIRQYPMWDAGSVALLKRLWVNGYSAGQIASRLRRSRNAVCAK